MESGQLIPEELLPSTILTGPSTQIAATINNKDGQPQSVQVITDSEGCPQYFQVFTDSEGRPQSLHLLTNDLEASTEAAVACRSVLENNDANEAGQSLIQPSGDGVWLNNQIQYVVIQKGVGGEQPTEDSPEDATTLIDTAAEELDDDTGFDKMQCGLCGKVVDSVKQFLCHKATHVGRGLGLGCEMCGLSFSRQLALRQHYRRKHKIPLDERQPPPDRLDKHGDRPYRKPPATRVRGTERGGGYRGNRMKADATGTAGSNFSEHFRELTEVTCSSVNQISESVTELAGSEHVECLADNDTEQHLVCLNQDEVRVTTDVSSSSETLLKVGQPFDENNSETFKLLKAGRSFDANTSETLKLLKAGHSVDANTSETITLLKAGQPFDAHTSETLRLLKASQSFDAKNSETLKLLKTGQSFDAQTSESLLKAGQSFNARTSGFNSVSEVQDTADEMEEEDNHSQDCMQYVSESKLESTGESADIETADETVIHDSPHENVIEITMPNHKDADLNYTEAEETVVSEPIKESQEVQEESVVETDEHNPPAAEMEVEYSNSAEKEDFVFNVKNNNKVQIHSDNARLRDTVSEKMIQLSHSIKKLAHELDMPDFQFIPIIEKKNKRSHIQGGRYSFQCLYCSLKFTWRTALCKHMRETHTDILKVGPLLNIPDKISSEHEVMKMSEYLKLETRASGRRIRGVETQDLPGEFLCDKCDKVFHRLRYLRKHQLVHQQEKNLLCTECVKSFRTVGNLKQHMKSHKDREAYKCSECDFESRVNIKIHAHRQLHSKGCVLCEICGSAYSDKSTLTKHKQVHNPLRPFPCQYPGCTWRFKTKVMCAAHFRSHTSKGKFECEICGYAFRQKHHLQRHEKKVHNIVQERAPAYSYLQPRKIPYNREETDTSTLIPGDADSHTGVTVCAAVNVNEASGEPVDEQFDLESALQTGQLVIATEDGSTINYEMSDMGMSMSYHTLLADGESHQLDSHAILVPQSDGSHVVYQHEEEVAETVDSEEKETPITS